MRKLASYNVQLSDFHQEDVPPADIKIRKPSFATPKKRVLSKAFINLQSNEASQFNKSVEITSRQNMTKETIDTHSHKKNLMSKYLTTKEVPEAPMFLEEPEPLIKRESQFKRIVNFNNQPAGMYERIIMNTPFNRTPDFQPLRTHKRR